MDTSKKVEIVPENTFQTMEHEEQIIEWINNNIEINAVGKEIRFVDRVVFVASKSDADEVINTLKSKFTSDGTLTTYISPEPIVQEAKVIPQSILSVSDAVNSILKGTRENDYHIVKEGEVLGGLLIVMIYLKRSFLNLTLLMKTPFCKLVKN